MARLLYYEFYRSNNIKIIARCIYFYSYSFLLLPFSYLAFLRTIFGLGRGSSSSRPKQTESGRTSQQDYSQRDRRSNDDEEEIYSENVPEKRHKKIFTQDDGEYVDFEEIK